ELGHALRRAAPVHAEVVGFGCAFDRGRTGAGLARAVAAALDEAGITAADLDHVNAHAPGTVEDDAWEARGLLRVPGMDAVPVLALKGYVGNPGPGAGMTELAASLAALRHGRVPATLNHDRASADCPLAVIREPRPVRKPFVLKTAGTELGQAAAVVVRRWE